MPFHNTDGQKQSCWSPGFGFVNNRSAEAWVIGMFPNIEYISNPFNRGVVLSWFGYGLFFGKVNTAMIDDDDP